jgi:gliding motility-associated-like protein
MKLLQDNPLYKKCFSTLLFILTMLMPTIVGAQIIPSLTGNPPTITCVRNDSINRIEVKWVKPANTGSCFKQWAIYVSQGSALGPYVKKDSVANINASSLKLNLSTGTFQFIYIVNEQSCNNPTPPAQLSSDTLDNLVPKPAVQIKTVTVENGKATVKWVPSTSQEVEAYVIYSSEDNFSTAIDTVFGRANFFYIDNSSDPSQKNYSYKIRTLEFCESPSGLLGNITGANNTILLNQIADDPCQRAITLSWSRYYNATVNGFVVEMKKQGEPDFSPVAQLIANDTLYQLKDLTPDVLFEVRIKALLNGDSSLSNVLTTSARGVLPVENHYIFQLSQVGESIELVYEPDPNTKTPLIAGERSNDGINFGELTSGVSITGPPPGTTFTLKDFGVNTNRFSYWYRMRVTDSCGNSYYTAPAKSILLKGENSGVNNDLEFTGFLIDSAVLTNYELLRIEGTDTIVATITTQAGELRDNNVFSNTKFAPVCYLVKANYSFTTPNRPSGNFSMFSNSVCLEPRPKASVPNAFVPDGYNKIFRPILSFAVNEGYLLEVFDRWSKKVFSSSDPILGWNGNCDGKPAPTDSYIYALTFRGVDGKEYKRTGYVLLVR